jgi:hypothetical protein
MPTTRGHCLCRALAYEFDGEPKWVAYCHCESCRRATSAAVATYLGVKLEQFRYLQGDPASYQSSPGVWRYFCPRCGSPMAYTADRYPGEVHLHIGTLADPNQFKPRGHVFAAEQLSWFEIADNLPRYAALGGKGVTPLRRGPRPAPGPEERR